jgi:hypothetical protein
MKSVSGWTLAIIVYCAAVLLTAIPLAQSLRGKGTTEFSPVYDSIDHLSDTAKQRLRANFDLLRPSVHEWCRLGASYGRFQSYSLFWTIIASVLVPILAQAIDGSVQAKWFLTLVSVHASLLLAFNKGLGVDDKVKLYRDAQNDLTDLHRTLHANPAALGGTPDEIVVAYFRELNDIAATVRVGEDKPIALPDSTSVAVPVSTKKA